MFFQSQAIPLVHLDRAKYLVNLCDSWGLKIMKISAAVSSLAVAFVLAACSSSGGSGGLSAAEIKALPITTKMPTTGRATYTGKAAGVVPVSGINLSMKANVTLDANFASSQIDGTLSRITATGQGVTVPVAGSLNGTGTINNSSFDVPLFGLLTVDGDSFYSTGNIFGDFKGADAAAVEGGVILDGEDLGDFTAVRQ
jgi:hypothetical protein